jgi:hypothetical protein
MADQSTFSKLPKKQLAFIIERLISDDFPIGNPYDGDYDGAYGTLSSIGNYFNIPVNDEDVQFFSKLLDINEDVVSELVANDGERLKDKSLYEQLEIPEAKTYDLHYTTWGVCNYTEYLSQKFDSYDIDWVRDSANQQRENGNWDYYEGTNVRDTEYENFEESDSSYDNVYEVNDDNATNFDVRRESMLDRLVIENTQDVVKSLDKKTLIKLKSIIESRLRLL